MKYYVEYYDRDLSGELDFDRFVTEYVNDDIADEDFARNAG